MSKCRRYEKNKIINIILKNHFEKFKKEKLPRIKSNEMRQYIINIIEKALNCGNIEYGYIKHKCLSCDEEYIHGFSCKSKFCTKCGRMYSIKRSEKQADNMLNVKHRHAVFTEGGIDKNNKWFKKLSYIAYKYLRKSWQKLVLDIIKTNFKDRET